MKKIVLLSITTVLIVIGISFLLNSFSREKMVEGFDAKLPKIQKINNLAQSENIVSICVADKNKLVATLEPAPNIILLNLEQNNDVRISSIYKRDGWKLNDVDFVDSLNGFAVGQYGTILKTVDGGQNWTLIPRFSEFDFQKVKFINQSVGYVAGRFGIKNKTSNKDEWSVEIFKTTDGGNSWIKSYHGENERDVFQIAVNEPEIALVSINGNKLIRTKNGGLNWEKIIYSGEEVTSLAFAADNTGWLVGGKGEFLKSDDLGMTWHNPTALPTGLQDIEWWSVDFDKNGNGLIVSEEGIVLYSNDNGKIWRKLPEKIDQPLRTVKIKDGLGIILGEDNIYKIDF